MIKTAGSAAVFVEHFPFCSMMRGQLEQRDLN